MVSPASPEFQERLDAHVREMVAFHFSDETGSPFWLDFKKKLDFDPRDRIRGFADLSCLGFFQDEWLRDLQPEVWVPAAFKGKPFNIFETGVDFREPRKPAPPDVAQDNALPWRSVMVMMVLLNDA